MSKLPLKPSQLMVEGFKKVGGNQITGDLVDWDYDLDKPIGYCSLGAIYAGYGLSDDQIRAGDDEQTAQRQLFDGWKAYHPETGSLQPIATVIVSLNDDYDWPWWKISNWLHEKLGL